MDFVELSDLEEGEILEYDSFSPVVSNEDFEVKKGPLGLVKKENTNRPFGIKDSSGRNFYFNQPRNYGCVNKNLREKTRFNGNVVQSCMKTIDLESISSEGEYVSDNNGKYQMPQKGQNACKGGMRKERKQNTYSYGTVEDIMSEIGETICRKSRCNYKKRKSKDFVRYSDNSYDLWRDKVFSNHIKEKKRKRKLSESDSEAEMCKGQVNKRRRRRRKRGGYSECGVAKKNLKARDFDEMRRNLLEKLNKQKAAESLKALTGSPAAEVDNSEIQEVDMLVDCTSYVDNPPDSVQGNSVNGVGPKQEKEGDEELDLIKLRLIALASNKKGKNEGNQSKTEAQESVQEEKKSSDSNIVKEVDVDRNELLLRAEALRTALLKKHQNRLKKLKVEKLKAVGSSNENDLNTPRPPGQEREACKEKELENGGGVSAQNHREITGEEERKLPDLPCDQVSNFQMDKVETQVSSWNPKKGNTKVRNKRRKRKSHLLANNLKENSEKSEVLEEDDRKLRNQLLNDLFLKKSMKDSENKPVLTDSVQTSANQIPIAKYESPNDNEKLPETKKNPLRKMNATKISKPVPVPSIPVPKIPVPEIQRIIVHLGSEDSSDENGPQEEEKTPIGEKKGAAKVEETAEEESANPTGKVQENIQASYERSVELLLSQARKKIEGKMQSAKTNALTTPEAVYKHLPPSQRLEYIRLKQKIAERERLKQLKNEYPSADSKRVDESNPDAGNSQKPKTESKAENSLAMGNSTVSSNFRSVKTGVPNVKLTSVVRNVNGTIVRTTGPRVVANKLKNNLVGVHGKVLKGKGFVAAGAGMKGPQTSNSLLLPSSQALITKLKLLLKKIKIEKTIEENYEKEISKLKNQLNLFERKKTEQRFKIKKLGEESMKTYRAIQGITGKSKEKATLREESGIDKEKKKEESERLKEEGKQSQEGKNVPCELEKRMSKVESEKDKERMSEVCGGSDGVDVRRTNGTISSEPPLVAGLVKYSSPLEVFKKVSDGSDKVDPNVMMCQFDLMGTCKDEECTYQHLRKS